jgi:hypothetical protein
MSPQLLGDLEPRYGLASEQMVIDDLGHVRLLDPAVHDRLWVDQDARPRGAGPQAPGGGDLELAEEVAPLQLPEKAFEDLAAALLGAGSAGMVQGALLGADEDVLGGSGHGSSMLQLRRMESGWFWWLL